MNWIGSGRVRVVYVFLMAISVGYASGLGLEYAIEGDSAKISNFKFEQIFDTQTYSLIKSAELSGTLQSIISHANIALDVEPLIAQDETGSNYFINRVNECTFHSSESIAGSFFYEDSLDDGICIICKIKGKCVDVITSFTDLPHGSQIGAINTELAPHGIVVTGTNFGSGPDTVIIFDGGIPEGDNDEDPIPDPDLRETGICTDCADLKMLIIPENVNDDDFNNLVDLPDDEAAGGIIKFQFNQPRKIVSFDLIDHDGGNSNDKYFVYSDFSCNSPLGNVNGVALPSTGDGEKTTVMVNQDNAQCLKIKYHDSGAVTNLNLECVETSDKGTVIGSSQIDLSNGYQASQAISIPFEDDIIPIIESHGVEINIASTILDFGELDHGDALNNNFLADYGVSISGCANDNNNNCIPRDPIVFDTDLGNTSDDDLEVDIGNISIVQENILGCPAVGNPGTCDDPDDNARGGEQVFKFNPERYVNSLVFVDADRPYDIGTISLYSDYNCNNLIDDGVIPIPSQEGVEGNLQVLVPVNIEKVGCMKAVYGDSGGLSRINFGCPLPDDPIIATFDWDYEPPSNYEESIHFFTYENNDPMYPNEEQNWNPSQSQPGHYFDRISGGDFYAHGGSKVLAGWGNFDPQYTSYDRDPLDISGYHDVVLSVWYSYEDTETVDDFYFYYKDGANWVPIIEIGENEAETADISPLQSEWKNKIVNIPAHINSLELRFEWSTSWDTEHVMIDNLEILGTPN